MAYKTTLQGQVFTFDTIKEVISELENLHQISRGKTLENKILYTRKY